MTKRKPPKVDLFPKSVLDRIAEEGTPDPPDKGRDRSGDEEGDPLRARRTVTIPGHGGRREVTLPAPLDFAAPSAEEVKAKRLEWLGPTYRALTTPLVPGGPPVAPGEAGDGATFQQHLDAEAALSLLPAVLLGAIARPVANYLYELIDHIPSQIRRPFEKIFGLLIDQALSGSSALTGPIVDESVKRFHSDPSALPTSKQIPLQGFSQTWVSCAESAVSAILKGAGEAIALGDIDTQFPGFDGTSGLVDVEFWRRGLTVISGVGTLTRLKSFLASGYPVLVSVGWAGGGGHYAVATGYDDDSGMFTIRSYDALGSTNQVGYEDFAADWARRQNMMTAVIPRRDPRIEPLIRSIDLRRRTEIANGFSLSDFWVTAGGKVFVEAAFRYVSDAGTDITARVNFDSAEVSIDRQLGGSFAIKQRIAPDWFIGVRVEKMSLWGTEDGWRSFDTAPISLYGSLEGPGFELRAGSERGGFQASLAADLGKELAGLGVRVNVSVEADGTYRVFGALSGTF